jgi:hypothetical protein
MSDEAAYPGTQDSATRPDNTRLQSARLRADIIRVAGKVAETQDRLVETLSRLASQHPHEARRLRATIEAAGNYAARMRSLAIDLQVSDPDSQARNADSVDSPS